MTTQTWPFGTDAKQDDPLTAMRIPVVTSFNPSWFYVAAYLDVDTSKYGWGSRERPTEAEAQMLASFLQEHRNYWFNNEGYAHRMDQRPLDIDSGWNTYVFIKYAENDWGYRRVSWIYGPTFIPEPPHFTDRKLGPLTLEQVMDRCHTIGDDEPMDHWSTWKAAHPDVFGTAK